MKTTCHMSSQEQWSKECCCKEVRTSSLQSTVKLLINAVHFSVAPFSNQMLHRDGDWLSDARSVDVKPT